MLDYIYFFIIFLIISLLYLHLKQQYYVSGNFNDINYIDYEITKNQFQELCNSKIPFIYKYNISEEEKLFQKDSLINNYNNFEINHNSNSIVLNDFFSNEKKFNYYESSNNESFLENTDLFTKLYTNDYFLRPCFTAHYKYDVLLLKESDSQDYNILKNKFYATYIHCIDNTVQIKLVSPKYDSYFQKHNQNKEIISNLKMKNIPLFNDELMASDKNYCKIQSKTIILHPGDLLYIPPLWYFSCKSNDNYNISLCYNYMTYMNSVLFLPDLLDSTIKYVNNNFI